MRKLTTVFSLWLCTLSALSAQTAFPVQDAVWEEAAFTIAGQFIRYRLLCGDTTINDQSYAKLYDIQFPFDGEEIPSDTIPPAVYAGSLRVDGPQVYYLSPFQDEELLLYDFSLEAEASIELPNITMGNEGTYNVTNVDTVTIDGTERKRIFLENVFGQTEDVWIEGIGSVVYGLLDRGLGLVFDSGSRLQCVQFTADDFVFKPDINGPCWQVVTGCEILSHAFEHNAYAGKIRLFPNPSRGQVQLELPHDGATWQIELWGLDGRLLDQSEHRQGGYDWSRLPRGTYMLKVLRNGQYVFGERLVLGR
ncbi:MAG: T9SS type A sorting domain-containing protein [Saprospiraceae bacterium]|nr:T9SS type A sorting domain-containing protein [Lewinella sp.]